MPDGKLEKEYGVHCALCEKGFLGLGSTTKRAVHELVINDWKKRKGLWICPTCEVSR